MKINILTSLGRSQYQYQGCQWSTITVDCINIISCLITGAIINIINTRCKTALSSHHTIHYNSHVFTFTPLLPSPLIICFPYRQPHFKHTVSSAKTSKCFSTWNPIVTLLLEAVVRIFPSVHVQFQYDYQNAKGNTVSFVSGEYWNTLITTC